MILNETQQRGHDMIIDFVKSRLPLFTIGGYAGTGKTTLIGETLAELRRDKPLRIAFCAYTGKASHVLKGKISLGPEDYCGTIHGLMYKLVGKVGRRLIWERQDHIDYDLIILDEASMVDGDIFEDLRSYGVPILAVGDHGQLPPVQGRFNLMEHPEFRLETIVRQAEGNPIIKLASMARETGVIPYGEYGPGVAKVRGTERIKTESPDIILCATNKTRINVNAFIRKKLEFLDISPMVGEQVICLKNNREAGIFNGMIGRVEGIDSRGAFYNADIDFGEFVYNGMILAAQFGEKYLIDTYCADSFDWAYAVTVHKAQGSEFRSVLLIEERMYKMDDEQWRRWLYTGVTRAKERLLIMTR